MQGWCGWYRRDAVGTWRVWLVQKGYRCDMEGLGDAGRECVVLGVVQ
jgi:hypothetical protein